MSISGCSDRREVEPSVLNIEAFEDGMDMSGELEDEMEKPSLKPEESTMKSDSIVVDQVRVNYAAGGSSVRSDLRAELDVLEQRIQADNLSFDELMRIQEEVLQLTALVEAWESM